jgi:hypothetical protein
MFIPLKMVLIGIDPYPSMVTSFLEDFPHRFSPRVFFHIQQAFNTMATSTRPVDPELPVESGRRDCWESWRRNEQKLLVSYN